VAAHAASQTSVAAMLSWENRSPPSGGPHLVEPTDGQGSVISDFLTHSSRSRVASRSCSMNAQANSGPHLPGILACPLVDSAGTESATRNKPQFAQAGAIATTAAPRWCSAAAPAGY
jgi:hypothetical protein